MRITLINQFFDPDTGPTARLAASLAEDRVRLGDSVTVITSCNHYTTASTSQPSRHDSSMQGAAGLRIIRTRLLNLGKLYLIGRVLDYLLFFLKTAWYVAWLPRQDVVITMTTPPLIGLAAVIHKRLYPQSRFVLWNMDCFPESAERAGLLSPGSFSGRILHRVTRYIIASADHVICLDESMQNHLLAVQPETTKTTDISIIPNWERRIDFPEEANYREPFSPDNDFSYTVVYAGNLGRGHRFDTVLEAATQLQNRPIRFLFNGDGYGRQEIQETCIQQNLANVQLQDYVSQAELKRLFRSSLCGIITLRDNMCGIMSPSKLHALLAMGVPILYVGPRGSNVDIAICNYHCGLSLRHGQSKELASFILRLLNEPDYHADLCSQARLAFDDRYNDQVSLQEFNHLLTKTVA